MNTTMKRSARTLATLAMFIATPVVTPAFAAPVWIQTIPLADGAGGAVAASPNGKLVYVANHGTDNVSVITVASATVTATIDLLADSEPVSVAFAPNGKKAYVANDGGLSVSVITVAAESVTSSIPFPYQYAPISVTFSPNSKQAYVVTAPNSAVLAIREH